MISIEQQTICSLYLHKDRLGVSSYSEGDITYRQFYITFEADILFYLNVLNPDTLVINESMAKFIETHEVQGKIIMIKPGDYAEQKVKKILLQLNADGQSEEIRYNKLRKTLDFSQDEIIKSLSLLISYLISHKHITSKFPLTHLNSQSCNVQIPSCTYEYLQLIREQIHPSSAKGKGKSKQGFTVFNLYSSVTATKHGAKYLLHKFLKPLTKKAEIQERQNIIAYIHKNLLEKQKLIAQALRKIYNLKILMRKFQLANVQIEDWRKLKLSLENIMKLNELLKISDHESVPQMIYNLSQSQHFGSISQSLRLIANVLNLQLFEIKSNVSTQLDQLRQDYSRINLELQGFSIKYSQIWSMDVKIVYIPQVGYLVNTLHEVRKEDWVFEFQNEGGYFYSNQNTRSLDKEYGDKYAQIQDIEKEIMIELEDIIKERERSIIEIYQMVGQFDSMLALAKISKNFVRPVISSNTFIIKNGWHVLLSGQPVVNNTFSYPFKQSDKAQMYNSQLNLANSNYSNRCLLISGANGSGKTLYTKQIAIILFLAHIGSYVPAQFCTIPLVDSILSFHPICSLLEKRSGIKEQLLELNRMISSLTRRSFIVIDQFGHSCSYFEAERIIYSLIQYFTSFEFPESRIFNESTDTSSHCKLPFSIIITHMKDLFNKDLKYTPHLRHIQTLINTGSNSIQYLYKISPGCYSGNHAIQVCQRMGLDSKFLEIAEQIREDIQELKPKNQTAFVLNEQLLNKIKIDID